MKTYELYNLTTGELLADNLTFNDVPELLGAYTDFFPGCEIIVCCRETPIVRPSVKIINSDEMSKRLFLVEWFNFMDELLLMDNIY